MKSKALIYILFFIPFLSLSQNKIKDSLSLHFSTIVNDSLRIVEYKKTANHYKNKNPELHWFVIQKGLQSYINKKFTAQFTVEKGVYFKKRGQVDSAITYYKSAIAKFKAINDTLGEYKTIGTLANAYKAKGKYELAIDNLLKAISFFETKADRYPQGIIFNKNNLGGLYVGLKDWKKADYYFQEVYKHPFTKKHKQILSSTLINLTITNTELNKLDKALEYALEAEKIEKRPRSLANLYNNIGSLQQKKENYKLADVYYTKSLNINETLKSEDAIQRSYNNLGNNAIKLKDYNKAEHYLLKSNNLLEVTNNINSLRFNYEMLTLLYTETNNYKKALKYSLKEKQIIDSIFGKEKQKAIADFEVKYETEKKERENDLIEKKLEISNLQNSKNRNLFIASVLVASLLLLVLLFYFSRLKAKKKSEIIKLELEETQKRLILEKQYKNAELKALKSQMNPHFIFNALNSIQEYIVMNKQNLASTYLVKFSRLIRMYLEQTQEQDVTLAEEIEALNLYLELEKVRFETELVYTINIHENLPLKTVKVPALFIQPYVENAIKHGLHHLENNRKLDITFKQSNNYLECKIKDNGIGREAALKIKQQQSQYYKSFATEANIKRVELINKGREHKIEVVINDLMEQNKPAGTEVVILFPIK